MRYRDLLKTAGQTALVVTGLGQALPASAAPTAGPSSSPIGSTCPAPCVEDARNRPKANIHDPDRQRVRDTQGATPGNPARAQTPAADSDGAAPTGQPATPRP
ncbi:MAG: hypothetical protein C0434_08990 [Xanthomonadaceae bacterium]|nr:hypothetical protein [Xanthomonadaceae bacterium]